MGERITVISCNMKLWREALNASGGWRKKLGAFKSYMAAKLASYQKISYVVGQWRTINRPGNTLCFCLFAFFLASSLSPHVAGPADQTIRSISGSPNRIPPLYRSANGLVLEKLNSMEKNRWRRAKKKKKKLFSSFPQSVVWSHSLNQHILW